jgi:hypothetical protein
VEISTNGMTAAAAAVPHASTTTTGRNKRKQPCSTSRSNSGDNNAYQAAYAGFTFEPVRPAASEGCLLPGTLHSLFKDTYAVSYKHCRSAAAAAADGTKEGVGDDDDEHCKHADSAVAGGTGQQQMRVHQHANGLWCCCRSSSCCGSTSTAPRWVTLVIGRSSFKRTKRRPRRPPKNASEGQSSSKERSCWTTPWVRCDRSMRSSPLNANTNNSTVASSCPARLWERARAQPERHHGLAANGSAASRYLAVILPTSPFPPPSPATTTHTTEETFNGQQDGLTSRPKLVRDTPHTHSPDCSR